MTLVSFLGAAVVSGAVLAGDTWLPADGVAKGHRITAPPDFTFAPLPVTPVN